MLQLKHLKVIALAVVYVLHVSFFDALMDNGPRDSASASCIAHTHHHTHNNDASAGFSYRLLTKHEQSKQAFVNIPHAVATVTCSFTGFIEQHTIQPLFGAFAQLGANSFGLYRLYRVFRI
jgi:hypothetical protein